MIHTITALLLTFVIFPAIAQEQSPEDSALKFAQGFYHWYVVNDEPLGTAIKRNFFSSELSRALKEDIAAQEKSDEIVGLDFDPVTSSQDPSDQYFLGRPTKKKDGYWINVYSSRTNQKRGKPDVIAVVNEVNRHWVFSNFRYPNNDDPQEDDLLGLLRFLRADRQQ